MDFYEVLGVANNASGDEIKRAFKKLAVRFHPDKTKDPKDHAKFVQINEAYETLKDSGKRQQYDHKTRIFEAESYSNPLRNFYKPFFDSDGFLAFQQSPTRADFERERRKRAEELMADQKARERQQLYQRLAREEELRQKAAQAREDAERRSRELREQRMRQERRSAGDYHEDPLNGENKSESYENRRQRAYRSAWHGSGTNSSDPIVLSDEENISHEPKEPWRGKVEQDAPKQEFGRSTDQSGVGQQSFNSGHNNTSDTRTNNYQPASDAGVSSRYNAPESDEDSEDDRYDSEKDEFFDAKNLFGVPIREVPRKSRGYRSMGPRTFSKVNGRASPVRQNFESYERNKSPEKSPLRASRTSQSPERNKMGNSNSTPNAGKKFKPNSFNFNALDETLSPGPEISMEGLEGVLPRTPKRVNSNIPQGHKRFKGPSSEYMDGRAHADTIFRPVNGKTALAGKFASLTMKDWGADPEILHMKAPTVPVLSKVGPGELIKVLTQYDKDFGTYKRRILGYQQRRLDRDEMFQTMKYDAKEFGVYRKCVEQDAVIARRFSEAHNEYVVTMLSLNSRG